MDSSMDNVYYSRHRRLIALLARSLVVVMVVADRQSTMDDAVI